MLAEFIQLPKAGETAGLFQLNKVLSTSILGTFYAATHRLTNEECLLMVLPEALLKADGKFRKRFEELAVAQKGMAEGSAVMPARELSEDKGNLIVQYAAGQYRSLTQIILEASKPLNPEQAIPLLQRLANGLNAAATIHQGHFFLTPDFIFIDESGVARIAGVGIFQSIAYPSFERYVSAAILPIIQDKKKTFSALEILSPEIRNYRTHDPRSDLYCIGMSAYFVLVGVKPVRNWVLPSQARPELGTHWDLLLSRCLEPNPGDRFPHFQAFLKELDGLQAVRSAASPKGGRALRALTRIPLPQALESRLGLRGILMLRLFMLVFAGVLAVFAGWLFRAILLTDLSDPEDHRWAVRVEQAERANLILRTMPTDARVAILGIPGPPIQSPDGQVLLNLSRGKFKVHVQKERFHPEVFLIEITRGERVERRITMRPAFGDLEIQANPDSSIWHVGATDVPLFLGTADGAGRLLVSQRLIAGAHRLQARHPLSKVAEMETQIIAGESVQLTFEQPVLTASLQIDSDPQGANVRINGEVVGQTPLRMDSIQPGGDIELRIEALNYHPFATTLRLDPGQQLDFPATVQLVPVTGKVAIELRVPESLEVDSDRLEVLVDEVLLPLDAATQVELPVGEKRIAVRHPDFFPIEATFTVEAGVVRVLAVNMRPRPGRLLPVIPADRSAAFNLNGQQVARRADGTIELPPGVEHRVQVRVRDFQPVSSSFTLSPNQEKRWEIDFQPLPGPETGENWTIPYMDLQLNWIQPGEFMLGSPVTEYRRTPNEDNRTAVRITTGFWIGTTELTQAQFTRILTTNPSVYEGPDLPVDSVSWALASEFCERLTELERTAGRLPEGFVYRLPTEAEWEYAARAGTDTAFSLGPSASSLDARFHGAYLGDPPPEVFGRNEYGTVAVASFPPNPWGLFDVHGNLAEWTLDRYWDRHPGGFAEDPFNDQRGRGRSIRGGSWRDTADAARSASRAGAPEDRGRSSIGFRIALAPQR